MKLLCSPQLGEKREDHDLQVLLFGRGPVSGVSATAGAAIVEAARKYKCDPDQAALDLLALAISVNAADRCVRRAGSPDGWTRTMELEVSLQHPELWEGQVSAIEQALQVLTTDRWGIRLLGGGYAFERAKDAVPVAADCVSLLSGGLDSLIGGIDLKASGSAPLLVSQITGSEGRQQVRFAEALHLKHFRFDDVTRLGANLETSMRARSFLFLAYGVLAATTLQRYKNGDVVELNVPENGFISLNPPLTPLRIGSLSTRTTHPVFMGLFQHVLDAVGLHVKLMSPYQLRTKGEMLIGCRDPLLLKEHASVSVSCGKYGRSHKHCGRCLPCLVRRAAFLRSGIVDHTAYRFTDLSRDDMNHKRFDDVVSVAMAVETVRRHGIERFVLTSLTGVDPAAVDALIGVAGRGIGELEDLLEGLGVI